MLTKNKTEEDSGKSLKTIPFKDAEEAWFWFVAAQEARLDGARFAAGQSLMPRPCEPVDILKVLDRLYRNRRLLRDHLLVLRHYGRRHMPPDERRPKEMCAFRLWYEALERIGEVLERKGIVEPPPAQHKNWIGESLRMETAAGWEVAAE